MEKLITLIDDSEVFDYTPEGTDSVIQYRRIGMAEGRRIRERHTKTKINRHTRQPYRDTDWDAVGLDMLDAAIVGWSKIAGDPSCTRENKFRLPGVIRADLVDLVDEAKVLGADETRKNS